MKIKKEIRQDPYPELMRIAFSKLEDLEEEVLKER